MRALLLTLLLLLPCAAQAQTVTLLQWNIQEGVGTDGNYSPARQATVLTAGSMDILTLQEFPVNNIVHYTDQIGGTFTLAVSLANDPGRSDGNALWVRTSTVTVNSTHTRALTTGVNPTSGLDGIGWDGSTVVRKTAVGAKVTKGGFQFFAVSAHLCWSACADSSGSTSSVQRVTQANDLISWIETTRGGLPVILAGDLNFGPDYPKAGGGLQHDLFTDDGYTDLWQQGIAEAKATANWGDRDADTIADMPMTNLTTRTHDTRRIDYVFLKGANLLLIELPDSRATCSVALTTGGAYKQCPDVTQQWDIPDDQGIRASDHNAITVSFDQSTPITVCNFHTAVRCQAQ